MNTVKRILALQKQEGISNKELEKAAKLANGSVTNWKNNRYFPSVNAIISLAQYFHVTTDYLLCLSDISSPKNVENSLTPEEQLLIENFQKSTVEGKFHIIQVCMNERDNATNKKEKNVLTAK